MCLPVADEVYSILINMSDNGASIALAGAIGKAFQPAALASTDPRLAPQGAYICVRLLRGHSTCGFGNFHLAAHVCSAHDEWHDYFRHRSRMHEVVPLGGPAGAVPHPVGGVAGNAQASVGSQPTRTALFLRLSVSRLPPYAPKLDATISEDSRPRAPALCGVASAPGRLGSTMTEAATRGDPGSP